MLNRCKIALNRYIPCEDTRTYILQHIVLSFIMDKIQNYYMARKKRPARSSRRSVRRSARSKRSSRSSGQNKSKSNRYDAKFYKIVPSTIFGVLGLFYLLTPYSKLVELGLDLGKTNAEHLVFGIVFLGIATAFWLINSKKKN